MEEKQYLITNVITGDEHVIGMKELLTLAGYEQNDIGYHRLKWIENQRLLLNNTFKIFELHKSSTQEVKMKDYVPKDKPYRLDNKTNQGVNINNLNKGYIGAYKK